MKRTTSCDYIGQSLKRVKISTSPGELRLDKDIETLINENHWTCSNYWMSNNTLSSSRCHGELRHKNARLVRDPVDPLRLRLTCLHQPFSQSLYERWTIQIQIPRMYPHLPPLVPRVTRELITNENISSNVGIGASAAIVASSMLQAEPPIPDQILILSPPPPRDKFDAVNCRELNIHENSKFLSIDEATAVYSSWSPINTLRDLLDFLIAIPAKRREWWAVGINRLHHQQQLRLIRANSTTTSMSDNENIETTRCSFHMHHQDSSSSPGLESDDDLVELMDVTSTHEPCADAEKLMAFPSNRFDVGYDRTPSFPHADMMQR